MPAKDPAVTTDMAQDAGSISVLSEPAPGEIFGLSPVEEARGVWNAALARSPKGLSCEYSSPGLGGASGVATGSAELAWSGGAGDCCVVGKSSDAWNKMKEKLKSCKH